jgi:two-component system OmpR family response regulator
MANATAAPLRVFVVEDSALLRNRIIENLASLGRFDVVGFAESEDEAVAAIERLRPDVVVADIRLRQGNGIEVVRQVRAADAVPRPRIYILTNYAYPEYRAHCSLAGADAFFDKSSEYDRFISELQHLM